MGKLVAKSLAGNLDYKQTAVDSRGKDVSSQEVKQQFKRSKRTAIADIERVELHPPGETSTAYRLVIRTTDGKAAKLFVTADQAPSAIDLLSRALGPRLQTQFSVCS